MPLDDGFTGIVSSERKRLTSLGETRRPQAPTPGSIPLVSTAEDGVCPGGSAQARLVRPWRSQNAHAREGPEGLLRWRWVVVTPTTAKTAVPTR